jgi:hypothetical protein
MAFSSRAYWLGFALGIAIGVGSFFAGCSWERCVKPSMLGSYLTPLHEAT